MTSKKFSLAIEWSTVNWTRELRSTVRIHNDVAAFARICKVVRALERVLVKRGITASRLTLGNDRASG
jgi:hypothetical protein